MSEQWVPHHRETWPWRYGKLRRDVEFRIWRGHGETPEFNCHPVYAGTVVKIVMVSRLGDVGITTDLSADTGYSARVLLSDIEPEPSP